MKVIRKGSRNNLVYRWQNFLRGQGFPVTADGDFGKNTELYTKHYQANEGLEDDGVVGSITFKHAASDGFVLVREIAIIGKPAGAKALSSRARAELFGEIEYEHIPTEHNREKVECINGWNTENVKKVHIPELIPIKGSSDVWFHVLGHEQLKRLFAELAEKGLLQDILSWGGSYCMRLIRGSKTRLSSHAWASSFDINMSWNRLGRTPAPEGEKGSVVAIAEIAYKHGFFWGGHFNNRPDGMHFEMFKLITYLD